jgi:hypothetical protein
MISLPGWGPQSCLSVHAKTGGRERKFFISATIASENINYQMINGTSGLPPEKVTIQRADRTISEELALAIHQIWKRALLGTKEEESDRGDDGETTVFSAQIDAHTERRGRIWSPRGGMPKRFIELGKELEKFASDKDSDEKNMLEKVKAFERTFPEP